MITSLCYLVSSHVSYGEPLKRLLKSMEYIPRQSICPVIGGCTSGPIFHEDVWRLGHNSFDYTSLIALIGGFLPPSEHVFLLHDTMEFTPETDALIRQADPEMDATAAVDGGQCNLCLFRTDYLMSKRKEIWNMKACSKLEAVQFEGVLWKDAPKRALYPNATVDVLGEEKVYGGAIRRTERYNALKLFKHKSSWGQQMETIGERVNP